MESKVVHSREPSRAGRRRLTDSRWWGWVSRVLIVISALVAGAVGFTAPAHAVVDPAVWVGSPLSATWPTGSSLPANHHIPYGGDWSADFQSVGVGAPVVLYAAPQDPAVSIGARVEIVRPACASGVISQGGYRVTGGLLRRGYQDRDRDLRAHQPVGRPGRRHFAVGTQLGTVGSYNASSCWTGPHVHFEMYSQHNYACYNRTWAPGQRMNSTNFVGFTGGAYAFGRRAPCP